METKHCIDCGNDIPSIARKCTHCGSYQGFRRYLDYSKSVLALLIAFVSVSVLALERGCQAYKTVSVDPLAPIVSTRIMDVTIDQIEIIFNNNEASRVYIHDGILCRIPTVKDNVKLFVDDGSIFRRPNADEVSNVYAIHFRNEPSKGRFLEPGSSSVLPFARSEVLLEKGLPIRSGARVITAYCFVQYVGQDASEDGAFVLIGPVYAESLGNALKNLAGDQIVGGR